MISTATPLLGSVSLLLSAALRFSVFSVVLNLSLSVKNIPNCFALTIISIWKT